jgi:hypothetical protein
MNTSVKVKDEFKEKHKVKVRIFFLLKGGHKLSTYL